MASTPSQGPRPFTVLLVLAIILCVAGFFAFNAFRNTLLPKPSANSAMNNSLTTSNLAIDPKCDKTERLAERLYTGGQVVSAKLTGKDICELTLSQGEHIRYPTQWSVGYYLTLWSEIAFVYDEFNPENEPDMTLTDLNIPWEGDLEMTLSLHLTRLSAQTQESVTPLMFETDLGSKRETTLGKRPALELTSKSYPDKLYYLFVEGPTQRVWSLEINNAAFFRDHQEEITQITDSMYYGSL